MEAIASKQNDLPREFIIKISSRCNINCSYCYMYNLGDSTALLQPKTISIELVHILARKLQIYKVKYGLPLLRIALHGGEPLLAGKLKFSTYCEDLFAALGEGFELYVQTNGILIDHEWVDIFSKYKIVVGLSLDGPQEIHDKYRKTHGGAGTFAKT